MPDFAWMVIVLAAVGLAWLALAALAVRLWRRRP